MAFKDISVVLYGGSIKLDYKDGNHAYYVRDRIDFDLPEDNKDAWSKTRRPKGTTTLLGDTLEKKGLMTWPMGMALRELFGFYNFTTDEGKKMIGFSKEKELKDGELIETGHLMGTLWELTESNRTAPYTSEELLPLIKSASENYLRKQKKGADIGSVVHDAIEHFVLANPNVLAPVLLEKPVEDLSDDERTKLDVSGLDYSDLSSVGIPQMNADGTPQMAIPEVQPSSFDIGENYMWNIKEAEYETEADRDVAMNEFEEDVKQASTAFEQFVIWWSTARPALVGAEQLVYSKEYDVSGTFDGLIRLNGKLVLCDWKTSKASASKAAAAPEGVYYSYFIQSAIYALAYMEMHRTGTKTVASPSEDGGTIYKGEYEPADKNIDDLLIVSARKDGGFSLLYASELGLSIDDLLSWAKAVISCYRFADKTKAALLARAEPAKEAA